MNNGKWFEYRQASGDVGLVNLNLSLATAIKPGRGGTTVVWFGAEIVIVEASLDQVVGDARTTP